MQGLIHNSIFEKAVLFDSSALYALADTRDQYHQIATSLLRTIQKNNLPLFITNAVIIESYRLILHKLGRNNARRFLKAILKDIEKGTVKLERMLKSDELEGHKIVFQNQGYDL